MRIAPFDPREVTSEDESPSFMAIRWFDNGLDGPDAFDLADEYSVTDAWAPEVIDWVTGLPDLDGRTPSLIEVWVLSKGLADRHATLIWQSRPHSWIPEDRSLTTRLSVSSDN